MQVVVELELALIERKQYRRFRHNSICHMPERYERVRIGWHCAKVKGHAELKIEKPRVKTFIYNFPKLHHSSPNSFGANVHLRQFLLKTVKVIESSRDVTPRSKVGKLKGHPRNPPVPQIWCNSEHYSGSYRILKKWNAPFFFDRSPS